MAEDMPQNPTPQVAFRRSRFAPNFTSNELSTIGNQPPAVAQSPVAPISEVEEPRRPESRLASVTSAFGGGDREEQPGPTGVPGFGSAVPGAFGSPAAADRTVGDVLEGQVRGMVDPVGLAKTALGVPGPLGFTIDALTEFGKEMMAKEPLSDEDRQKQKNAMFKSFIAATPFGPLPGLVGDLMETQTMQDLLSDPALQGHRPDIGDPEVQAGLARDVKKSQETGGLFGEPSGSLEARRDQRDMNAIGGGGVPGTSGPRGVRSEGATSTPAQRGDVEGTVSIEGTRDPGLSDPNEGRDTSSLGEGVSPGQRGENDSPSLGEGVSPGQRGENDSPGPGGGVGGDPGNSGGDAGCFAGDTPILMADGTERPIKDVRLGDMVMAFDGLGPLEPRRVVGLMVHAGREVRDIGVLVTPEHRFLTPDGDHKPLEQIIEREGLAINADGGSVAITARDGGRADVHNIDVEDLHTYVAGGLRVHNWKYKGGRVDRAEMIGPNPPGPDEGFTPIQSKEGVLARPAMAKIGPQNLKVLNANPQAQAAVAHILEEYRQPKSRLAHVKGMMG